MENLSDRFTLYQEILQTSFEKLKKSLPKKYKEINDMLVAFIDQLKQDKELNANKYFALFKLCIETKDAKLIETSIYYIHKLISHEFLDGNCRDLIVEDNIEENKNGEEDGQQDKNKRLLIDTIVETVCSCRAEKNENVQLQVIKVLLTLMTTLKFEVHGDSLQETIHTLFTIHLTSKNTVNQTTAKAALSQIVHELFRRMEEYNARPEDYYSKQRNTHGGATPNSATLPNGSILDQSPGINTINPYPTLSPVEKSSSLSQTVDFHNSHTIIGNIFDQPEAGETLLLRTPQERYIHRCLEQIVDDVCIYHEKVKDLEREYEEKEDKSGLQDEIKKITLHAVPSKADADSFKQKPIKPVKLENERGEKAGTVGWCFVCRGSANLYCKDTRVPLCSLECKLQHLDELQFLSSLENRSEKQKLAYLEDSQRIFIYLCQASGKDPANDLNAMAMGCKILSLELLVSIMENPGPTFVSNARFKELVKEHLCDSVLKNSVSTNRPVFSYSLGIFVSLVNNFRDILKAEIAVFIEDIFLRMLESENSGFHHRSLALQVFYKICSKAKPILEFYVNYDCNINSSNKFEKMVEMLCKIAQGKYSRPEYGSIITTNQAIQLKVLALESLVKMVKSLVQYTQDYQKKVEDLLKQRKTTAHDEETEIEKEIEEKELENVTGAEAFNKMDEIERQRTMKNETVKAIQKFNFKIKYGMKYFTQLGLIDPEDAASIGYFFKNTPNLSKEMLGEYFGDENPFNIKVLTEFTNLVDFKNMKIDEALRIFLALFDLPGEGQKIDRIMQVFASKYFEDNPTSFKSGGAAYTLAFALIMLQTDIHSKTIKEKDKMKLPSFINMTRGINDGENLPVEELTGYFNRISESPLALHAAAKSKNKQHEASLQSLRKKEEQFRLESEAMIEKGQKLIKQKHEGLYYKVSNPDPIRSLFTEIIWSSVLPVYSVLFEQSDDQKIVKLCLEGLSDAILLCGLHHMETEKNAFVTTLAKFTNLAGIREIKEKNIECIKTMLQLGIVHGNLLRKSWREILSCISKINYFFNEYVPAVESEDQSEATKRKDAILNSVCETIQLNVDLNVVNYVYSRSNTFELEEILDFITCLCQISEEELRSPHGPSTYSLQKIVEVAHFNVDRVKFVWSQIWNIMKEHIIVAATHSTREISFFAVDSLKQLSIKFLQREEMAKLEFQKEFLHPFETIYMNVNNDDLKELILNCCSYIIAHVQKNLKSGWKVIIDILGLSTEATKDSILRLSFSIVEKIMSTEVESLKDVFTDLAILLIKFAKCQQEDIASQALERFNNLILSQSQKGKNSESSNTQSQNAPSSPLEVKAFAGITDNSWKTILSSLAQLCVEKKKNKSALATQVLFDLLKTYGEHFPREFWKRVLHEVLKPLFGKIEAIRENNIRKNSISRGVDEVRGDNEPLRELFAKLMEMHTHFKSQLNFFTKDILELLVDCTIQHHEAVAKMSINTFRFLINNWSETFTESEWETIVAAFRIIFEKTIPKQLLTYKSGGDKNNLANGAEEHLSFNSQECLTHCIVQLWMVVFVRETVEQHDSHFSDKQVVELMQMVQKSYKFAKDFNEQKYLRFCLWKDDSMRQMDQLPGLVKQEKEALATSFVLLFKLYQRKNALEDQNRSDRVLYLEEFMSLGLDLIKSFCHKNEEYLSILAHEENEKKKQETSPRIKEAGDLSLDEAFRNQTHNLAKQELEREIINLQTVFSQTFLKKLLTIEVPEIESKLKELVKNLLDLSFYLVPRELAFSQNIKLNTRVFPTDLGAETTIRELLNKYFEYSMNKRASNA